MPALSSPRAGVRPRGGLGVRIESSQYLKWGNRKLNVQQPGHHSPSVTTLFISDNAMKFTFE